ncbi:hypothetical protein K1719_017048 [Acacia pycnantha]|nr:hypothetical protein K1719_017048 [Acacia pycnantha]
MLLSSSLSFNFPVFLKRIHKPKTEETNDVFISFSGDTRSDFTSHLEASFSRHGIDAFSDHQMERGADTFPTLLREIKRSKISVIVFSKGYAASDWCLDELVNIMERKRKGKQIVMPIFYGVKPKEVRKQSGIYADAFVEHEQSYRRRRVQRWRSAMKEAANVSGWDSSSYGKELIEPLNNKSFHACRKFQANVEVDSEELVDAPKVEDKIGAVPNGLSTDFDVAKRFSGLVML